MNSVIKFISFVSILSAQAFSQSCPPTEWFDYIIVGTNTGSVVARYLHDNTNKKILLIDRGFPAPTASDDILLTPRGVPEYTYGGEFNRFPGSQGVFSPTLLTFPEVERRKTTPQTAAFFREVDAYFGNVQGGTALLNSMYWVDSSAEFDLNEWPAGLKFEDMLASYRYVEKFTGDMTGVNTTVRGTTGLMNVRDEGCCYNDQTSPDFFQACANNNLVVNNDFSSNNLGGCGYVDRNLFKGRRQNPYDVFAKPVIGSRLKVLTRSEVTKVRYNIFTRTINGIFYNDLNTGATGCVHRANKEVILSAGAIGTPKILLNSGIGPTLQLTLNGIWTFANLPVGENLEDDVGAPLVYAAVQPGNPILNKTFLVEQYPDYLYKVQNNLDPADNVWTYAVSNSIAFVKSDETKDNDPTFPRNIQSYVSRSGPFNQIPDGQGDVIIFPVLLVDSKSRGSVSLNWDPNSDISLNPNYLSDDRDIDALYHGLLRMRKIAETEPFKSRLASEIAPGIFTSLDTSRRRRDFDEKLDQAFENVENVHKRSPMSEEEKEQALERAYRATLLETLIDVITQVINNAALVQGSSEGLPTVDDVLSSGFTELLNVMNASSKKRDLLLDLIKEFALKLYIRISSLVGQHYCCTARMGSTFDTNRVTDTRGRVLTVNGLRVIDMSSMPQIPRSNPMKRLLTFGRRLAEFVVQDS